MPDATAAPKPRRGIVVFIHVPPLQSAGSSGIVGLDLEARASANHTVKAHCGRWGRDLDGVIHVTIEVTVSTPPGALPVLSRAPRQKPPRRG